MQRTMKFMLVLVCIAAGIIVTYAFLNLPFYGNTLPPYNSQRNPVNLVFKFGTGARNELNTFHGTFTKDLISDGTVTARTIMSEAELKQIQQKLYETDFFNCPETFPLKEPLTMPDYSYQLMVQNGTTVKEVDWSNNSVIDDATAAKLDQLADFLVNMIAEKPEYQKLPPPTGAYL